jgi:putative oxidoreductase
MKKLFHTGIHPEYMNLVLLLIRIAVAVFMLTHGWPKLQRLVAGGEITFGDPLGIGMAPSLALAVFAEFFCSILVGIGLGTRWATIPLIITMAVAAFISHSADPFGRKEMALLYLLIYSFLLVAGSGKYSIDNIISRKRK